MKLNESIIKNLTEEDNFNLLDNMSRKDIINFYVQVCNIVEQKYNLEGLSEEILTTDIVINDTSNKNIPKTYAKLDNFYNQDVGIPILGKASISISLEIALWGDCFFKVSSEINHLGNTINKSLLSGKYNPDTKQITVRGRE